MSRSKKTINKYIEQFFLLAGSVLLIVMALIIGLNISRDAKIFAKTIAPPKKAVATQLPKNTGENDDYGTYKYTRDDYKSDDVEKDKHASVRIEIINKSGDKKLPGIVKATLNNAGYGNVVISKADTADTKALENPGSTPGNENIKSTAKADSINTQSNNTLSNTRESKAVNTPENVAEDSPQYTPQAVPSKNGTTPLPSGIDAGNEGNRAHDGEAVDNEDRQDKNIVNETQIIDRNNKQFGAEIKKIIKVGKVIKKIDTKYGYDVTIILGTDYNP